MKLKTAKIILLSACIIMVLLFFLGSAAKSSTFILVGAGIAFAGALFWIIFGRCPSCGKFLGRTNSQYCPHCGSKIGW